MLRSLVFLAAAFLLPMAASAQQQAPAQPEQTTAAPPPRGDCSNVDLAGDKSLAEIELVKACLEAKAIADPQGINSLSPAMATVLAAVIGLVTAGIGYF